MKIHLTHRYRGALTNEKWLEAGVHELDKSLATYLIDNGHAVAVAADVPVSEPEPEPVEDPMEYHNKIMKASGRDTYQSLESLQKQYISLTGQVVDLEWSREDIEQRIASHHERESLIAEYEALTGDTPAWNIGIDTLRARLAELRDD